MADNDSGGDGWTLRRLATHGTQVNAIVGAEFRETPAVITAANDGAVRVWDLADGHLRQAVVVDSSGEGLSMPTALATRGSTLFIGWSGGWISTLDLATGLEAPEKAPLHPGSAVTALLPLDLRDGRERLLSAATDGVLMLTGYGGPSSGFVDRVPLRSSPADQATPVWRLAALPVASQTLVFATVGEGGLDGWSFEGTSLGKLPPFDMDSWSQRSPLLPCVHPELPGSRLFVADFDQIVEVGVQAGIQLSRFGSGVGEVGAIAPFGIAGEPVLAVGGAGGRVALVDPLSADLVSQAPGDLHPAPARLHAVIPIGEPVTSLSRIEVGGRSVLLAGGHDGGVYLVEPPPRVSDRVELQDDVPETEAGDDRLRRSPLAEALAVRLRRRHEEGREASFLVHLDGRWGSGKTTVLNFVANQLGDGWTIVRYNAWRQSRVGPPWWTLLTALRDELVRRRSRVGRLRLWCREILEQRVLRAAGLPATALLLLVALGVFLLIRPSGGASTALTTVQGVAATLTALATLFAGAQFVARFFGWHSPRGAKAFQDLDTNPMDRVAEHFSWLVAQEKRPIAYFIDDIDRCPAEDVVELLENVQTLVRDAAEATTDGLSPCFVVAGDGAWIRNAFEEHYADFAEQIAEPGRPLGYLFLAKIFQLTLPVPRIGPVRQAQFFRELLGLSEEQGATDEVIAEAHQQVASAPNDDAQQAALAKFPRAVREIVAPAAVARQTEPAFAAATEHRLTGFAPLLPDNPRAVKRFLNAFAMTRSVRTVEGQAIPTAALALWTILQTRWPLLADALTDHPDWITPPDPTTPTPPIPDPINALLTHPDVRTVLTFPDGGPLTPALIRACSGG